MGFICIGENSNKAIELRNHDLDPVQLRKDYFPVSLPLGYRDGDLDPEEPPVFKLPTHIQEKFDKARAAEASKRAVFANLSDGDLAASAEFWMHHCAAPKRYTSDEPIYDATFWHVIVPELLRRLKK